MAESSAQCEELIQLSKQKNLVLMVHHTAAYSAVVRKMIKIIQAGDLGDIRYVNAQRLSLGLFKKDMNVV